MMSLRISRYGRTSRDASGASMPGTEIYALTYVPIGWRQHAAGCAHAQTDCPSWRRPTAQPPTRLVCPFSNLICKQLRPKAAEFLLLVSGEPVNGDCANCCLAQILNRESKKRERGDVILRSLWSEIVTLLATFAAQV